MVRRRLPTPPVLVNVKLHLRPDADADLLAFFAGIPAYRRAGGVKAALRAGGLPAAAADQRPDDGELLDQAARLLF